MESAGLRFSKQFDIHPNQIQDWKKRLVEGAEDVFDGKASEAQHNEKEVEKLYARIGQLAMANDVLSKVLGRDRCASAKQRHDSFHLLYEMNKVRRQLEHRGYGAIRRER